MRRVSHLSLLPTPGVSKTLQTLSAQRKSSLGEIKPRPQDLGQETSGEEVREGNGFYKGVRADVSVCLCFAVL